jgi:predicted PurR-regulated permease PerM
LFALAVARFSQALAPLLVAVIIAYVLHMPVDWVARRAPRIPRRLIAVLIYVLFYVGVALIPVALTPFVIQQVREINLDVERINARLTELAAQPIIIYNFSIDPRDVTAQAARSLAGAIWNSFFVGQLILCTLLGIIVGGSMAILGIRSALILGLVAAVAELVPNIGHTVSAVVGFTIALLEGSSYLPVSNLLFALIVVIVYIIIAQIDINILIPRIIGRRLHLPPVVVIMGLIAGASIGGVLGLLLAAPTLSSLLVLVGYLYRRLLDIEPYVLVNSEPAASAEAIQPAETRVHHQEDYVPMVEGD